MLRVVLYGNSLALSSVGAGLQSHEGLEVLPIDATLPDAAQRAHGFAADVLVFDVAAARPDALALWRNDPDMLLIGVDVNAEKGLVLSSAFTRVWTTNDLVQIIRSHAAVRRSHA